MQLFCQNLSLFAKLFIENKSVCFDVHTFLYYVLVAKNPEKPRSPVDDAASKSKRRSTRVGSEEPTPQIIGFYSKEKLSWDNNNLACILIFPPWQRLGLGQLLMGVSYDMGWREGRLGGPEKRRRLHSFVLHIHANSDLSAFFPRRALLPCLLVPNTR